MDDNSVRPAVRDLVYRFGHILEPGDGPHGNPVVHGDNDSPAGVPVDYPFEPNLFPNHVSSR